MMTDRFMSFNGRTKKCSKVVVLISVLLSLGLSSCDASASGCDSYIADDETFWVADENFWPAYMEQFNEAWWDNFFNLMADVRNFTFEEDITLYLTGVDFENFSMPGYRPDIEELVIEEGHILSFDYLAENFPNLRALSIRDTSIADNQPIPHIPTLTSLEISHRNALELIINNSHIDGRLLIDLNHMPSWSKMVEDYAVPVHISLEALQTFTNIRAFMHRGYASSLDVFYLQYAESLIALEVDRGTTYVENVEQLINLPDLKVLLLPFDGPQRQAFRVAESGIFRDNVYIGGGS